MVLARVMVFVGDVDGSAEWYAQHFGFRKLDAGYEPGSWREIEVGPGLTIAFHQAFDQNGPMKRPTGSPTNPHKLVFKVADVAATRTRLIGEGVQMFDLVDDAGHERCDGLDLEGHRFQLCDR